MQLNISCSDNQYSPKLQQSVFWPSFFVSFPKGGNTLQSLTPNKLRLGVLLACSAGLMSSAINAAPTFSNNTFNEIDAEQEIAQFAAQNQSNNANVSFEPASFNIPNIDAKHLSDGLIIKYKPTAAGISAKALAKRTRTNMKFQRKTFNGASVYKLDRFYPNVELQSMVDELATDPSIEFVEINKRMYPLLTPNDTNYGVQWHYSEAIGGLNVTSAWDIATGAGVNVAVIDTGITNHSDLNANVVGGYDFVSNASNARDGNGRDSNPADEGDWTSGECGPASGSSWHGSHVAGTVAAVTNNNKGVAGVAFNAKIVPLRALAKCGGTTADIADAMVWASGGSVNGVPANTNPAKVINLSLGGGGSCSSTSQNAINTARNNGSVVVVAAGNSNSNVANFTPASCNGVISVAANNRQGNRASYSNFGNLIDVAAPGGEGGSDGVASTVNAGDTTPTTESYAYYAGTSMAAPHVAGVAAMMFEVNPSLTPTEVENILKSSARSFPSGSNCTTSNCGDGIVDALAAVQAASPSNPPPPPPPTGDGVLTNGVAETGLSGATGNEQFFTLEVPAGATNLNFAMSGGSGDADLYVRYGSKPTTSSYDCRPFVGGNTESCPVSNVQAGTYHVMVRAYSTYSGVSVTGSYDVAPPPPPPGAGGSASVDNVSAARRAWKRYTVDIPAGMSTLTVDMSGGTGDADLYVNFGSQSSTSSYDCRPYKNGNNESCSFNNPQAGTWHIDVRAYSAFSGVSIDVEWAP